MLEGALGCSRSHGTPGRVPDETDASAPLDPPDANRSRADARDAHDAGGPERADAGEDAAAARDAAVADDAGDLRLCEPGWPTTKGQWTLEAAGRTWLCSGPGGLAGEPDPDPEALGCCLIGEE